MKKLKFKVFLTIFLLLSFFLVSLCFSSLTRNYLERKKVVEDTLNRLSMDSRRERNDIDRDKIPFPVERDDNVRRVYLDFTIYTIILDDNGNYKSVISNTENDTLNEEEIKTIAEDIIKSHDDDYHVGNLYTNKYAYTFTKNALIIMDNSNTNKQLINQLTTTIMLFIALEIVSFIII